MLIFAYKDKQTYVKCTSKIKENFPDIQTDVVYKTIISDEQTLTELLSFSSEKVNVYKTDMTHMIFYKTVGLSPDKLRVVNNVKGVRGEFVVPRRFTKSFRVYDSKYITGLLNTSNIKKLFIVNCPAFTDKRIPETCTSMTVIGCPKIDGYIGGAERMVYNKSGLLGDIIIPDVCNHFSIHGCEDVTSVTGQSMYINLTRCTGITGTITIELPCSSFIIDRCTGITGINGCATYTSCQKTGLQGIVHITDNCETIDVSDSRGVTGFTGGAKRMRFDRTSISGNIRLMKSVEEFDVYMCSDILSVYGENIRILNIYGTAIIGRLRTSITYKSIFVDENQMGCVFPDNNMQLTLLDSVYWDKVIERT